MTTLEGNAAPASAEASSVGTVRNLGEPLRFTNVEPMVGFSAEPAQGGQTMKVWTRLALTSDMPLFHRIVESLAGVVSHMAQQKGAGIRLHRADMVLLVLKADNTATLWLDTVAVSIRCRIKRSVAAGAPVFEQDIADVNGMTFPCVEFEPTDKVLCLFRQDWRFGLAFDFNPEGKFEIEEFATTLGAIYRQLRYRHLYDAIEDVELCDKLITVGWFPFAEIITTEFKDILRHCESGFDLAKVEEQTIAKFDESRLQNIYERWVAKPHFSAKAALLKEAIDAFGQTKPVTVIKILLTEIEGILNDAYRATHNGQGAKLKELLAFAEASAIQQAGGADTLLFPAAFGRYLNAHTFANFDPVAKKAKPVHVTLSDTARQIRIATQCPELSKQYCRSTSLLSTRDNRESRVHAHRGTTLNDGGSSTTGLHCCCNEDTSIRAPPSSSRWRPRAEQRLSTERNQSVVR